MSTHNIGFRGAEVFLISTNNIDVCGEIRKVFT